MGGFRLWGWFWGMLARGKALESCRLDLFALFDEPSGINPFLNPLCHRPFSFCDLSLCVMLLLYHIVCYSTILSVCVSHVLSGTSLILLLKSLCFITWQCSFWISLNNLHVACLMTHLHRVQQYHGEGSSTDQSDFIINNCKQGFSWVKMDTGVFNYWNIWRLKCCKKMSTWIYDFGKWGLNLNFLYLLGIGMGSVDTWRV